MLQFAHQQTLTGSGIMGFPSTDLCY